MQRVGAQYLAKRVTDYVMAPSAAAGEEIQETAPNLDGQVIHDDQGAPLGRAHLVQQVSVYVVASSSAEVEDRLRECIGDPGSQVFFQTHSDRLTGLIYVPDPARQTGGITATRSDDV